MIVLYFITKLLISEKKYSFPMMNQFFLSPISNLLVVNQTVYPQP